MIDLKPNQFIIKNGKLQPREAQNQKTNSRIVPYNHTVRLSCEDYYHNTLMGYKRQIQGLRKNYGQLQNAYWKLLGSSQIQQNLKLSKYSPNIHESILKDNQTQLESSSIYQSIIIDSISSPRNLLNDSDNEIRTPLKKAIMCESLMLNTNDTTTDQNPEEDIKQVKKKMKLFKRQLEETKQKVKYEDDMKQFYETNMKRMQDILERQRKHTKLLNGVISRMRTQMEQKDDILKYILNTKNIDKGTVKKMVKGKKLNL